MQDTYTITHKQLEQAIKDRQVVTVIINGEYYDLIEEKEKEQKA